MPAPIRTVLTLPGDARLLRLVQEFVLTLAEMADLTPDQARPLAQGVEEACKNCLDCDLDEEDPGDYSLIGELTPTALTLSVCDRGLPFDEGLEAPEAPSGSETLAPACLRHQGLSLIHRCADEVRWINHGPEGKELRLTKYRTGSCRLEPHPVVPSPQHQAALPQESRECDIRLLRPEDAIRVAQLMYRVYGYSYTNEDFYYPERLEHDLETGRHVGVVAVAANGEIVGHVGVERPDLGPLAELGQLAVAPAYRGLGLKRRMGDRLQEEINKLGLTGLFGEAVTLHPISQEGSESRGLRVAAIKLLDWQARFKKMESLHPGLSQVPGEDERPPRETMVFYFKYLAPPALTAICPPSRHRQMLARIYGNLGVSPHLLQPSGSLRSGKLAVHYDQAIRVGTIQVNRIGLDTLPEICRARRDLCDIAGAEVVGLDLPLSQGATPYLCEAAEAEGFFFSGVRPLFAADGDFLRLQYLKAPLDLERVCLYSPFARELLDYILKEKERVSQIQGK